MQFTQGSSSDDWRAKIVCRGVDVDLQIDHSRPKDDLDGLAKEFISRVDAAWNDVRQNLLQSLLSLYNTRWIDPDQGYGPLEADEFLSRIAIKRIHIMDAGDWPILYFDDSGLFGGHTIEVSWDGGGKMYKAALMG